jgi:lysophospholipase L1-like esterase
MRNAWAKKLLLLFSSLLIGCLLLEVVFRQVGYRPLYEVYSKPEIFWRKDPQLGWSLTPGAHDRYVGPRPFPIQFRQQIRINSLGLRGPELQELPPGGRRIIFLGDSETAGFEVAEGQTFASVVGEIVEPQLGAPVQAINAGIRGYGTDQALLLYRERLRRLRPDLVVYDQVSNDIDDNMTLHRPRRPFGKPAFAMRPDGTLRPVGVPVPEYPFCSSYRLNEQSQVRRVDGLASRAFCTVQTYLSDRSALFSFVTTRVRQNPQLLKRLWNAGQAGEAPVQPTAPPPQPSAPAPPVTVTAAPPVTGRETDYPHELTTALVLELARLVHGDGAKLMVIASVSDLERQDVAALIRAGVQVIRQEQILGADQTPLRFLNDGHLNPRGHRQLANGLAPAILEQLRQ